MMNRKYIELHVAMLRAGMTQEELGAVIGRSQAYVTRRIHGHAPWTLDDMYKICDRLSIPHDQITFYFPPGGVAKPAPALKEVKRA